MRRKSDAYGLPDRRRVARVAFRAVLRLLDHRVQSHQCAAPHEEEPCSTVCRCVSKSKNNSLTMEHAVRKPVESRRAYRKRKNTIVLGMILALVLAAAMAVLLVG